MVLRWDGSAEWALHLRLKDGPDAVYTERVSAGQTRWLNHRYVTDVTIGLDFRLRLRTALTVRTH